LEPQFMWATGLHVVDAVIALFGIPSAWSVENRNIAGTNWNFLSLRCNPTLVQIEIMPTTGKETERFEFFGADFAVTAHTGHVTRRGWHAWQNGQLVSKGSPRADTPAFVAEGTFAETEAFLAAVRGERGFCPTPVELELASEICAGCPLPV